MWRRLLNQICTLYKKTDRNRGGRQENGEEHGRKRGRYKYMSGAAARTGKFKIIGRLRII